MEATFATRYGKDFVQALEGGDLTLVCRDGTVRCHSQILSVASRVMADLMTATPGDNALLQVDDCMSDWVVTLYILYPLENPPNVDLSCMLPLLRVCYKYDIPKGMAMVRDLAAKMTLGFKGSHFEWVVSRDVIDGGVLMRTFQSDTVAMIVRVISGNVELSVDVTRMTRRQYDVAVLNSADPWDVSKMLRWTFVQRSGQWVCMLGSVDEVFGPPGNRQDVPIHVYSYLPHSSNPAKFRLALDTADPLSVWSVLEEAARTPDTALVDTIVDLIARHAWMAKVHAGFAKGLHATLPRLTLGQQARIWKGV